MSGVNVEVRPSAKGRAGFCDVRFKERPPEEVRSALKRAGFRWSGRTGVWYGWKDKLPDQVEQLAKGGTDGATG